MIPVDDAKYFYDGYEIAGEVGDYIKVGTNSPVLIQAVDEDNDTLAVTPSISWGSGDEIFICDSDGTVWDNIGCAQPSFTLFDGSVLDAPQTDELTATLVD